jgi:two-component system chemotaxis response regulator CheB
MPDIVVIGASAGGVAAVSKLVRQLPGNLPASIFVTIHIPEQSNSSLPRILTQKGQLPALAPADGESIQQGRIYVAPPDRHMLIKRGYLRLVRGPRENGARPSIDPMFRTAARAYGKRVIGVVLSGALDDGTAGLIAVKKQGGLAIVQDPDEALYDGMPRSAIAHANVDHVLPISLISKLLVELTEQPLEKGGDEPLSNEMEQETDIAELDLSVLHSVDKPGTSSRFSCPECQGVLWEIDEEGIVRFRCRVGHAYSPETLLAEQNNSVDVALWAGLRALEENAALMSRMAKKMRDQGNSRSAVRFNEQADGALGRAETLRRLILEREPVTVAEAERDHQMTTVEE